MSLVGDVKDLIEYAVGHARSLGPEARQHKEALFGKKARSVAAQARRNVFQFPLIISDSISYDTAAQLKEFSQTRAAIYTRLTISTQDIIDVKKDESKSKLLEKLRYNEEGYEPIKESFWSSPSGKDLLAEMALPIIEEMGEPFLCKKNIVKIEVENHPGAAGASSSGSQAPDYSQTMNSFSAAGLQKSDGSSLNNQDLSDFKIFLAGLHANGSKDLQDQLNDAGFRWNPASSDLDLDDIANWTQTNFHSVDDILTAINVGGNLNSFKSQINKSQNPGSAFNQKKFTEDVIKALKKQKEEESSLSPDEQEVKDRLDPHHTVKIAKADERILNRSRPLILELKVTYKLEEGGKALTTDLLIAIQSVVHALPSGDIMAGLERSAVGGSLFFRFLQATSGEIRFLRDFILDIDRARASAARSDMKGNIINTLRRQTETNRMRQNQIIRLFTQKNVVPPSATLAITVDEARMLKERRRFDLTKRIHAKKFMETHNLMNFYIVDEGVGVLYVWMDGSDNVERITFNEMKDRTNDRILRDTISVLSRQ